MNKHFYKTTLALLLLTLFYSQNLFSQGWFFLNSKPGPYDSKNNKVRFFGQDFGFLSSDATLFRTLSSSQEIWEISSMDSTIPFQANGYRYHGISFFNERYGARVANNGDNSSNSGLLGVTTNSGVSWNSVIINQWFYDVAMISTTEAVAIGGAPFNGTPVIYRTTNAGINWNLVSTGLTGGTLRSVKFIDANSGISVGNGGRIIKTTDKGVSWVTITSGTIQDLNSVYFIDANTGIACGNTGAMLRTTNGGNNWTALGMVTNQKLNDVWFSGSTTGFIVGERKNILKTTDAGIGWTLVQGNLGGPPDMNYNGVSFINSNTGYICGDSSLLMKTTNGGTNWTDQRYKISPANGNIFWDMSFVNPSTGYLICQAIPTFSSGYSVMKTTNGGTNFSFVTPGGLVPGYSIRSIKFQDANTGIIITEERPTFTYFYRVYRTTTGGSSWTLTDTLTKDEEYSFFSNIEFFNANTGVIFSERTFDDVGSIFRTTNGGIKWDSMPGSGPLEFGNGFHKTVSIVNSTTCYFGSFNTFMKTTNTGLNWTFRASPGFIDDMQFLDENTGYASTSSFLYKTTDGAFTWSDPLNAQSYSISNFKFVHPDTAYLLDHRGILKSTNGGLNWFGIVNMHHSLTMYKMEFINSNNAFAIGFPSLLMKTTGAGLLAPISKTVNAKVIPEAIYNAATNKTMRKDTVKAYLRNISSPYNLVDSAATVIDSVSFLGIFKFLNASGGTYYLVVKHRNTIETWSKSTGVTISGTAVNYDFTTFATQAFGSNMKQIDVTPTRFGIFSGDVNQDGVIDATDLSAVDNDASNFVTGNYVITDLNFDGIVDATDLGVTDNNSANFVTVIRP